MTATRLSHATEQRLAILFHSEARDAAARLLVEQCANNLPFLDGLNAHELERFQFAALKLSGGDLAKLRTAVKLAQTDWRDLLMAAGFGEDIQAHLRWMPERTN